MTMLAERTRGSWRQGLILATALLGVLTAHCSGGYQAGDDPPTEPDPKAKPDKCASGGPGCNAPTPSGTSSASTPPAPPSTAPPSPTPCTDECDTAGKKRCSASSSAGVEICAQGASGCLSWTQSSDCATDSSCDKEKNDGTCKPGCTSDQGCGSGNVGAVRCTTNSTAEQTCTQAGACYQWKTTKTNIPQQCVSPSYCSGGQRYKCVATTGAACVQHVAALDACAAGSACQGAGTCVATCTNDAGCSATNVNATRCVTTGGRTRQACVKSGACYVWSATVACSPDETCQSGQCVTPSCDDPGCSAAKVNTTKCVTEGGRSRQICLKSGACYKWSATQGCAPDAACSAGNCL